MSSNSHQAVIGILAAFLCAVFVFGSAALSLLGRGSILIPEMIPTDGPGPRLIPTRPALPQTPIAIVVTAEFTRAASPAVSASPTPAQFLPTIALSTRSCAPPPGWVAYNIRGGDTLAGLASVFGVTQELLAWNNCLVIDTLMAGTILYVPFQLAEGGAPLDSGGFPQPTDKPNSQPNKPRCGAPPGWVMYRVQRGDTLFALSQLLHVTVQQLQQANCLGSSTLIRVGQTLFVPYLPVRPVKTTSAPTDAPVNPTETQPPAEPPPVETTPAPPTDPPPIETTEVVQPAHLSSQLAPSGKEVAPIESQILPTGFSIGPVSILARLSFNLLALLIMD